MSNNNRSIFLLWPYFLGTWEFVTMGQIQVQKSKEAPGAISGGQSCPP